jgi:hypothetical protein
VDIGVMDNWYEYRLATLATDIFCLSTLSGFSEKFVFVAGDITNTAQTILDCASAEELIFCRQNDLILRPFISSWKLDHVGSSRKHSTSREN